MNRLFIFFLAAALAMTVFNSCMDDCIEGNGQETTENRDLAAFSRIDLGGSYKLLLTRDSASSFSIHTHENLLPLIKTEVDNGRLRIYSDENICEEVVIAISLPELTSLTASGAVEVEMTNRFAADEFELDVSGAVEARLDMQANKIRTELSGAGEIAYRGKTGEHEVTISGAGELNALELVAGKYDIHVSGAAECNIHVLNELNAQASGASSVQYRGNPGVINENVSGAGSIKPVN
ncbi:putative autotransporter adhesin-like protein [Anseongella ginsenosidimutans]|uniref:Putative autotransporter adhesin-like protein n=1 Tax=Anseongella ginsenosidimutans TaxID=496056 RepID=A0A4R3KT08_9SPHI|nr:head GIN domain-containing protein [Anseongella ginsenosidimutans]QEC53387.1 DUF2807 domain-containing protein [Anseongella ginsenosidimutans]TCS88274.1 putative autotransporter adhesin-like protein [Anseongella ginsenosidimutans]